VAVLGQFDLDLGARLPNFTREGANKTHLYARTYEPSGKDLAIFGSYEYAAENKAVADWLNQQFLAEVETALGLAVILAGQRVREHLNAGWRDLARHLPLKPITEIELWEPWVERHYPVSGTRGPIFPRV
jgi:hypothetical protein